MTDFTERAPERRKAFNEIAEAYDRFRPSYPHQLVDDVIALADLPPAGRILELGCGPGTATVLFAPRGRPILALEQSPNLAALARRNCETLGKVEVEETRFEDWNPGSRRFDLFLAAQSFHLFERSWAFATAASLLKPTGSLAIVWNLRMPGDSTAHQAVYDAYDRFGQDLNRHQGDEDEPFEDDVDASGLFESVYMCRYRWVQRYSAAEYLGLLEGHATHRMLPVTRRTALFDAVRAGIESNGGFLDIEYLTRLYVARVS